MDTRIFLLTKKNHIFTARSEHIILSINTTGIPSELSRENMISSHEKNNISRSETSLGGSVAQWLGRLLWDPEIPGSRPALTTR